MIGRVINYLRRKKNEFHARLNSKKAIRQWEKNGRPLPPPHNYKISIISKYKKASGYKLFIETGTYLGDMVYAQLNNFSKIYSIELGEDLYRNAVQKFQQFPHVKILPGNSGKVLAELMKNIHEPAIFWLDGHYSGGITAKGEKECPIYEELDCIFNAGRFDHILLIDDARCFVGTVDYPTVKELTGYILERNPAATIDVENDIMRIQLKHS